jgi:hypothetical protein
LPHPTDDPSNSHLLLKRSFADILFDTPAVNVAVKFLTLPFTILEVPDSNIGPDTGYPD